MGVHNTPWKGAVLGKGSPIVMPCKTHCNFCRELCRNGWTNGCAVWVVDSGRPKEAQVQSYSIRQVAPMCPHGRAHWRRLANMIEPSICGSDAVWCQINLTTCFEKLPLTGKFSKFCSERIHRDTDRRVVFKFHEIWSTGNPWSRALLSWQKIFAWLSRSRYCADHAQSLPGRAPDNVLRVPQISSKSVHFWRSSMRTCEHHENRL